MGLVVYEIQNTHPGNVFRGVSLIVLFLGFYGCDLSRRSYNFIFILFLFLLFFILWTLISHWFLLLPLVHDRTWLARRYYSTLAFLPNVFEKINGLTIAQI